MTVQSQVSAAEWALRVELACAYRLVAHFGWDDLIFTHLSVRVPGPEHHFLINPLHLMFDEITASSLVKIDVQGRSLLPADGITNPAGVVLHSGIHMARTDAQAVMHLHTPMGQAVSAQADGLLPLTQTAMLLRDDIAYHDYAGVAIDPEERERVVADLGDKHLMILRNHGTLTVGESVAEAFIRLYFLERACEAQIHALAGGVEVNTPPQGAPDKTAAQAAQGADGLRIAGTMLAWPALRRRMDRLDPSYAD